MEAQRQAEEAAAAEAERIRLEEEAAAEVHDRFFTDNTGWTPFGNALLQFSNTILQNAH